MYSCIRSNLHPRSSRGRRAREPLADSLSSLYAQLTLQTHFLDWKVGYLRLSWNYSQLHDFKVSLGKDNGIAYLSLMMIVISRLVGQVVCTSVVKCSILVNRCLLPV